MFIILIINVNMKIGKFIKIYVLINNIDIVIKGIFNFLFDSYYEHRITELDKFINNINTLDIEYMKMY